MLKAIVLTSALILISAFVFSSGCQTRPPDTASPSSSPADQNQPPAVQFDADRAMTHVQRQVEFGPRPAGSEELAKTRQYIIGELQSYELKITTDEWVESTPIGNRTMANITAELPGKSDQTIIIASHYDTKLFKDFKFVGANDGASSTGVLMELARVLSAGPKPALTYWFVFFDGEEAFCAEWTECGTPEKPDNTYGSRRYVSQLGQQNKIHNLKAMILLDMVGYKELEIQKDYGSTPWLVETIWETAREIGFGKQFSRTFQEVEDDHTPFLKAGIDAIDIIQLDNYPYWHTAEDTIDKISVQSLKIVGDVVLASLPRIEQRLASRNR